MRINLRYNYHTNIKELRITKLRLTEIQRLLKILVEQKAGSTKGTEVRSNSLATKPDLSRNVNQ